MLNKDPGIVPEEAPIIILYGKYSVCKYNNIKDTKNTRHIYRRVYLVRNNEKFKVHKIDWCEGDLKLSDIENRNVGENNLNTRIKYIMVRIDKWYRTCSIPGILQLLEVAP